MPYPNKTAAAPVYIKYAAYGVGALLLYRFLSPLLAAAGVTPAQLANDVKADTYEKSTGANAQTVQKAQSIAKTVHDAFHGSVFSEDEDLAFDAIKRCKTLHELETVASIYQAEYSYDLRQEFHRYTSSYNVWSNDVPEFILKYLDL